MKTVLITGVAGLIGSRLADWIIKTQPDVKVIGVDNLSGGYIENVNPKVKFYNLDLKDDILGLCFTDNNVDYVYHFAAYAAEGLSPFIRKFNYENNLISTANIINNCIKYGVKRLVFSSSMAVYGNGTPPFDEEDRPNPIDPYGIAKYACEMDIKVAGEQHGLDWCIIRPHNVYGVNQNIWDKYRNVIGIWMYQHLNNQPMTIFGDGEQKRAFSYIDDCLSPLWLASQNSNCSKEIINLGGTQEFTINEVNYKLRNVLNNDNVIYLESRHEVKFAHPTYQKSVDLLNYRDITTIYQGLSKMWEWAQAQPNRKRFVWENYELDKGIYNFWK